jgi:hypothetical protein
MDNINQCLLFKDFIDLKYELTVVERMNKHFIFYVIFVESLVKTPTKEKGGIRQRRLSHCIYDCVSWL